MLQPMMFEGLPNGLAEVQSIGQVLQQQLIAVTAVKTVSKISELVDGVLKANIGIIVAGEQPTPYLPILKDMKNEGLKSHRRNPLSVDQETVLQKVYERIQLFYAEGSAVQN